MRVLLVSAGSHGDLNPFIAIGRALRERGHDAALLAAPSFQSQIEEAGLTFFRMIDDERDLAAISRDHPDIMHPRKGPKVVVDLLIKNAVRASFPRILELAPSIKPDVIVHHHIVPSAAWAADKLGIPSVPVVLAPMLWFSKGDIISPMQSSPTYPGPIWRWFVRTLMPTGVRWQLDRPMRPILREFGLPKDTPLFYQITRGGALNLGMWSPHFRGPCLGDPPHGVICGFPWHDRHGQQEAVPDEVEKFLGEGEPPILFTLGTAAVHVAGDFYEHAAEACRILNRRGLLLVGPKRPAPANMPKGTRAFEYVPFSAVMPRCVVNVHHGGIGSTGQALRAGKPTLVIPHAHDQFDNAARLKRLGVSETLPRGRVTGERLVGVLGGVLADSAKSREAHKVGELVRAEDGAAKASTVIAKLFSSTSGGPTSSYPAMKPDGPSQHTRLYVLRGIDSKGVSHEVRLAATSEDDAVRLMGARGFSGVELLAGDFLQIMPRGSTSPLPPPSPQHVVKTAQTSRTRYRLRGLWVVYRRFGLLPIVALIALASRAAYSRPFSLFDAVLVGIFFAPVGIWTLLRSRAVDLEWAIQDGSIRANHERVLELVDRFERATKGKLRDEFVLMATTRWRAKALARLGRGQEAIALVEQLRGDARVQPAMYQLLRGETFLSLRQYERAMECFEELARLEPNNIASWFSLVDVLALRLVRPSEARLALDHLKEMNVSKEHIPGVQYSEAMVLLSEGRYAESRSLFESCLPHFVSLTRGSPEARGLLAMLRTQLAIACARLGDMESARRQFKEAEPLLVLHKFDELLARTRSAVGTTL